VFRTSRYSSLSGSGGSAASSVAGNVASVTVVGYVWFAFGDTPHVEGSWVRVERSARYLYKAFIRPGYRRRGFAPRMYAGASALCPRRGRVLGTLAVEADNTAGLRTPRRVGWPLGRHR